MKKVLEIANYICFYGGFIAVFALGIEGVWLMVKGDITNSLLALILGVIVLKYLDQLYGDSNEK